MILYLDTSAYVRVYVREAGHDQMWSATQGASEIATHLITYAEMRAALARMQRMGRLIAEEAASIKATFEQDWDKTLKISPTEAMMRRAGDLAERFGLRGYDSVHLAAAESLRSQSVDSLRFACFDERLNQSAAELGLPLLV
jgi:predicted nucleic acid-binding protein